MIYSPITKLTAAPHDPRRVTIHLEGQAVKARFLGLFVRVAKMRVCRSRMMRDLRVLRALNQLTCDAVCPILFAVC